ncbi:MAG: hypothetical protein K1X74_18485 [Pirellulales bacterium]|nr:hypothetical protein [Pirellulales bacterium]
MSALRCVPIRLILLSLLTLTVICPLRAAVARDLTRHEQLCRQVLDQLLTVVERPSGWDEWPPRLVVIDSDDCNANAGPVYIDGKRVPQIRVYAGEIELIAEFDPDALAFTIAHELGHLVLDHSRRGSKIVEHFDGHEIPLLVCATDREMESEADLFGMQKALEARFDIEKLRMNMRNSRRQYRQYSSPEGLTKDHPAWEARCELVESDENQQLLWRSMATFRDGVFFLETEQYALAEACFRRVVQAFPKCHEGYANLGYALLMQYCEQLAADDLRDFDIGHLVVGGFYHAAEQLEAEIDRGKDVTELWFEAVGAMRQALVLRDDLLLVKANLAVAYLVSPEGKDVGQAERLFSEVLSTLASGKFESIDPLVRAAILVNATAGRPDGDPRLVEQALLAVQATREFAPSESSYHTLEAALELNLARVLAVTGQADERRAALRLFESYLSTIRPENVFWNVAYEQYVKLSNSLGLPGKSVEELTRRERNTWRPVSTIDLGEGRLVSLADLTAHVEQALGAADSTTSLLRGTSLALRGYANYGIELLTTNEVLAVILRDEAAPAITLQQSGLGGGEAQLHVGMSAQELEALLGTEWRAERTFLFDAETPYRYYREAGIAVRIKQGRVCELVIVRTNTPGQA